MMELIRAYKAKPWPKLEIPSMGRLQYISIVFYMAALIGVGLYILFSGNIRAVYFVLLAGAIPLLLVFKSRHFFVVGLLTGEVVLAFLAVGNIGYIYYSVASFIGAVIAFESPNVMYALLILAVWFDMSQYGNIMSLTMEFIIIIGFLIGWMFRSMFSSKKLNPIVEYSGIYYALFILIWGILGLTVWSITNLGDRVYYFKILLLQMTFFIVTPLVLRDIKKLNWAIWTWIGLGFFISIVAVFGPAYEPPNLSGLDMSSAGYAAGAMGLHKNISASLLNLSFFMILASLYWVKGFYFRLFLIFGLVFSSFALFKQLSKGGMIGWAIGLLIFWLVETFLKQPRRSTITIIIRLFMLVAMAGLIATTVFYLGINNVLGTYGEIFTASADEGTMEFRILQWTTAWEMINKEGHTIRGLGAGAYYELGDAYGLPVQDYLKAQGIPIAFHPHNLFVDILVHYGIIGLTVFLFMTFSIVRSLWRHHLTSKIKKFKYLYLGLLCGLCSFYIQGMFDFAFLMTNRYWLFLGLCLAVMNVEKYVEKDETMPSIKGQK